MSNSEPSNTDLSQPEFSTRFLGAAPTKSPLTTPSEAAAEVRSPSTGGSDKDDTVNGYRHGTRPVTNPALKTNRDNFERYRLLEKLGQGGMGSVWKAQQIEPVKRDVAIKMINAAIANEDTRKRFFAERQTLARMGHPEIANILDGGTTPDGQPYLVMELAEGLPLDEFCQKHRLSIRARVELIERIARALSHAHERGIVHRDLKPTNILVSGTPDSAQFKIIDFGIAKVVEGACDTTDTATVAGQILGTPHFMSPEQANLNEQRIDVRSDVYALGVILYQLLTDATPLEACGIDCEASLPELLRCVVEEDAPRPSAYLRNTSDRNSLAADRSTSRKHLIRAISGDLDWLILKTLAKAADERYQSATSLADDIDRFLNFEPINAQRPTLRYRLNRWLHRKRSIVMLSALFSSALCLVLAIAFGVWRFNVGVAERRTEEIRQQVLTLVDDAELHLLSASELNSPTPSERVNTHRVANEHLLISDIAIEKARALLDTNDSIVGLNDRFSRVVKRYEYAVAAKELTRNLESGIATAMQFDDVTRAYARDLGRQEIERAFAQFGIEPNHQSPFEAADFCCSIPTIYRNDIVEAIHFWITESRPQLRNRTVEEIDVGSIAWWIDFLNAFDPDPWRINVRSALIANDHTKLASLVSGESSEIDLQLPFTRLLIADALSRMGQGSLAVAELKDAQRKFSNNAWLTQYLGKALMYEDEKDFAAAARYLTAAVSLSPENSMMHEALGEALYQTGNFRDAADQFRHALIISPKFVQAKQWLANSLIESGDFDEATAHLDAVLLECPEMSEAWTTKAILEQRLGNQTEAETSFRKASELKPNDDDLHLNLLSFLETSGQIPRAVEHLRKLIDSNRNSVTWNRYLGHLLLRDKRADEAIVFLDLVAKLDTEDFESHYDLGLAHHYAGNYSIALECYKRAKQLNPDNDKVNLAIESAQAWLTQSPENK